MAAGYEVEPDARPRGAFGPLSSGDGGVSGGLGSLGVMSRRRRVLALAVVGLVVIGAVIAVRLSREGASVETSALAQSLAGVDPPPPPTTTTSTTIDPAS